MALDEGGPVGNNDDCTGEDIVELGISCTLDMFKEAEEVSSIIDNIPETIKSEVKTEKSFEDLKTILDQYQVSNFIKLICHLLFL